MSGGEEAGGKKTLLSYIILGVLAEMCGRIGFYEYASLTTSFSTTTSRRRIGTTGVLRGTVAAYAYSSWQKRSRPATIIISQGSWGDSRGAGVV